MYAIEIHDICFGYESQEVLHNINLQIPEGALAVIVGPNGSGKSTLLRLMLGLLQPRYGEIRIFGERPECRLRDVGYVPQSLQFDQKFPISALDVVLMGRVERHFFGGYDKTDRNIAQDCLKRVGLDGMGDKQFAELSGGQRQRVLIAQALASQPKILLLDEPCANLDVDGAAAIHELLRDLNSRLTIVMVSHNLNMVEAFASHIICVNHTADMHTISEVDASALACGDWLHLKHDNCPIELTAAEAATCCHGPHHAAMEEGGQQSK